MARPVKRDTRLNLLFLVVFLAVSLPGAVILFKKKLDPNAARMDQPDAIVRQLPYMAPLPAPPGVKWVVPVQTRAWLLQLTDNQLLSASDDPRRWQPAISNDHIFQVMSCRYENAVVVISLIVWDRALSAAADDYAFTAGNVAVRIRSCAPVPVPQSIRRELMGLNEIRPPAAVTWIEADFPAASAGAGHVQVLMEYRGPGGPRRSSVRFSLPAAGTGNDGGGAPAPG